jgi:Protein kinase domain
MGVVYRATQLSLNRVIALKLLSSELSDDPGFRARFQREGQLQAALDHQHIVPVYEAGQTEFGLFLAMRIIDGPTLKDLIVTGQLNPRRSLRVLAQVARALDEAHDAGLIHRDIKPQNILIDSGDHTYLADFGLIKAPDDVARLTGTGQFIGTIDYVAPEQIQGEPATAASDCYALAAVLYECLTGEVPFPRPNEAATVHAHVVDPPPRVTDRRPDLPSAIDDVITRGMAKDPAERPPAATELISSATRALASMSTRGADTPPSISDLDDPSQTTRLRAGVAARTAAALARPAAGTHPAGALEPATAHARRDGAPRGARPGTGQQSIGVVLVIGLLAVAAAAAGYLVGHSGTTKHPVQFSNSAANGNLQLRYPSGWQLSTSLPSVPGMTFTSKLGLAPTPAVGDLTAGEVVDSGGPTLLPASFRARVTGGLPPGEPVLLGSLQGYRYSRLHVQGLDGTVTVYAVPTSTGVATIVCRASARDTGSFLTECGQVAATVRLVGATAFPLGTSPAYARLLSSSLNGLRADVRAPLSQLHRASTPSAQAHAAGQLARAYSNAASNLGGASVSPQFQDVQAAILAALRQISQGYAHAAAAAQSGDGGAYARAGQQVSGGSAALSKALHSLAGSGYTIG